MSSELCQQAIRELAYAKWEQAGCSHGDGIDYWLEAEQELIACSNKPATASAESCPAPLKISDGEIKLLKKKAG